MEGFFVGDRSAFDDFEQPDETPGYPVSVELRNLRIAPVLQGGGGPAQAPYSLGDADLEVLDNDGNGMGAYPLWAVRLAVTQETNALSGRLDAYIGSLAHAAAASVWDEWRSAPTAESGSWRRLALGEREGWVEVSALRHFYSGGGSADPVDGRDFSLDGRDVLDLASFYCAIGEAMRGPGGYFGGSLAGVSDCCRAFVAGEFDNVRLQWSNFAVTQAALSRVARSTPSRMSYSDLILKVLREAGIEVLLV